MQTSSASSVAWCAFKSMNDPTTQFETRGIAVGLKIGIPVHVVREAVDILQAAFGAEWLTERTRDKRPDDVVPVCVHPLGMMIDIAGASQVTEACEVALYLKTLAHTPRLPTVIRKMKNAQDYLPSLMQLAFAYRFLRIGAEAMELEPPVADGRVGDLGFRLDGNYYLAECYIPRALPWLPEGAGELRRAMNKIMDAISGEGDPLHRVLLVRPKRSITAKDRKWVVALVTRLAREVGREREAIYEDDALTVELRRVPSSELALYLPRDKGERYPEFYGGAHTFLFSRYVSQEELAAYQVRSVEHLNGPIRDVLLIWSPPCADAMPTADEWIDSLTDKISSKLAQARRDDEPRRLMIVGLHAADEDGEEVVSALERLGRRLAGRHDNYGGALFVSRTAWPNHRHGYVGYASAGSPQHTLPISAVAAHLSARTLVGDARAVGAPRRRWRSSARRMRHVI